MVAQQYQWMQGAWPGGPQAPTAWQRALQGQGAMQGAQQATPAAGAPFDRYSVARDNAAAAPDPNAGSMNFDAPNPPTPQLNGPMGQPGSQPYNWTTPPVPGGDNTIVLTNGGPAQGAGVFGTTYRDPGGGWNPWSLYDGREGFDGTSVDGWYDQTKDTAKPWGPNGQGERDRDRVWRHTFEALGPNPGGQPPERVKQVFLEQVARLKRDYMNTPGLGAQAWANSAFAGYDRMPGTQGGQAPGASAIGAASNAAAQAGHDTAAQTGGGMDPAQAAREAGQRAAQQAALAVKNGTQKVGSGLYDTGTGQSTMSGGLGQFKSTDWLTALNAAKDNPAMAAHLLRLAQGQTGRVTSRLGQYADNLYGRALQAYMNATGLAGSGIPDMQHGIQGFYGAMKGNNLIDFLGNAAGGIMGANFSGMDDQDIETQLRAAIALRSLGVGAGASSQLGSSLDNILYQQEARNLGGREYDTAENNLGTLLGGSAFKRYMDLFNQNR